VEFGHLGNILWGNTQVAGRFSKRHKRCIREEDNKSNKQVMDKLLIQMSLLGWFPVDPCADIEIYHIGRTDALSADRLFLL
jgi:hypothetical protein